MTWKEITGFEGKYNISDTGEVFSVKANKILKPNVNHKGYRYVCLYLNGKKNSLRIHKLVARHFIENGDSEKSHVNHKNCIKTDNRVENLEWCTAGENTRHAHASGRHDTWRTNKVVSKEISRRWW